MQRAESILFAFDDALRIEKLINMVNALVSAKLSGESYDDEYWEGFLDEKARSAFWRPSEAELEDWERRWFSTPPSQRANDPSLKTSWIFGSLVDAVRDSDVRLLGCRRVDTGSAVLEFEPYGWPFGGTAWMRALIEAFGGRVLNDTTEMPDTHHSD